MELFDGDKYVCDFSELPPKLRSKFCRNGIQKRGGIWKALLEEDCDDKSGNCTTTPEPVGNGVKIIPSASQQPFHILKECDAKSESQVSQRSLPLSSVFKDVDVENTSRPVKRKKRSDFGEKKKSKRVSSISEKVNPVVVPEKPKTRKRYLNKKPGRGKCPEVFRTNCGLPEGWTKVVCQSRLPSSVYSHWAYLIAPDGSEIRKKLQLDEFFRLHPEVGVEKVALNFVLPRPTTEIPSTLENGHSSEQGSSRSISPDSGSKNGAETLCGKRSGNCAPNDVVIPKIENPVTLQVPSEIPVKQVPSPKHVSKAKKYSKSSQKVVESVVSSKLGLRRSKKVTLDVLQSPEQAPIARIRRSARLSANSYKDSSPRKRDENQVDTSETLPDVNACVVKVENVSSDSEDEAYEYDDDLLSEDSADAEVDSSEEVLQRSVVSKSCDNLPDGWERLEIRKRLSNETTKVDLGYLTPDGSRLWTSRRLQEYLKHHNLPECPKLSKLFEKKKSPATASDTIESLGHKEIARCSDNLPKGWTKVVFRIGHGPNTGHLRVCFETPENNRLWTMCEVMKYYRRRGIEQFNRDPFKFKAGEKIVEGIKGPKPYKIISETSEGLPKGWKMVTYKFPNGKNVLRYYVCPEGKKLWNPSRLWNYVTEKKLDPSLFPFSSQFLRKMKKKSTSSDGEETNQSTAGTIFYSGKTKYVEVGRTDEDTPKGWTKVLLKRCVETGPRICRPCFLSPDGKLIWNKNHMSVYLRKNPNLSLKMDMFQFTRML
ncbi:unnamed protein product [Notodromas monacha]|uniref:MBD domain-containing protein n=1 Tax=Notodromas monacha TaxID=399045 RepID=A0A7R9GCG3_9CRUS|nr:unnamed protein product [Notodromas monacha]CAG0917405.1 unnamed protein product [Notodromas monacha]